MNIPDRDKLRSYVERIERLKEEQDALTGDIRAVYGEAKDDDLDKTALGRVVAARRKRAKDQTKYDQAEALFDLYMHSLDSDASHTHTYAREAQPTHESRAETAVATEAAGDDLRKPAAVVSGQIVRGGGAPREARNGEGRKAAHPDTVSQAKTEEVGGNKVSPPADNAVSRPSRGGGTPAPVSVAEVRIASGPFRPDLEIPAQLRRA